MGSWHLFPSLAARLLEYLASRELGFGQPVPLLHACCPTSLSIDFPRAWFWAAGTSSPRLLPNFSCIWLPASLLLGNRHLFSTLAAQLLEYLTSRELAFEQLAPLLRACCPTSRVFDFPRTYFCAANTSSPRLLPNFSSIWLPADLVLGSQYLFPAFAAQTSSRQTTAEQILTHSKLKTAAINQQVHHQRKRAHTGSFSQIVSILGEVKLVNIYIRYSWHLGSH